MSGTYHPEAIPIHDTAPSESEPPESTLLPCGCDPSIQDCAICAPRPVEPVPTHPPFMNREQAHRVNSTNILCDALEITGGDRQAAYGSPKDNWSRTAKIAQAITGLDCLTPEVCVKVAMAMKQARLIQTPNHRDSMVDLAGYSWVLSEVVK